MATDDGIKIVERTIAAVGGWFLWGSQVEGVASRIYAYRIGSNLLLMQTFIRDGKEDGYVLFTPTEGNLVADDVKLIHRLAESSRREEAAKVQPVQPALTAGPDHGR